MSAAAGERLNRYLARRGVASRRTADALISAGRVTVNGQRGELGTRVDADRDSVVVDGAPVGEPAPAAVIALNKPAGVVSTARDPQGRPTVLELVGELPGLVSVGRLDADSRGLLLLTTDGELAHRVAHPRFGVQKRYRVALGSAPDDGIPRRLVEGVELDDGLARALHAEWVPGRSGHLELLMGEGRKREVRRMCAALGLEVADLVRVAVGPVQLDGLPEGASRPLAAAELTALRTVVGLVDRPVVTVDGPAGSGKSTLGRRLAPLLGVPFLDTGLFYRAVGVAAARAGVPPADAWALGRVAMHADIRIEAAAGRGADVRLDGRPLGDALYDPAHADMLAAVSASPSVRAALLQPQRALAGNGVVAAGRDCGTVVFPWARLKLYLQAGEPTREARRARQLAARGARADQAVLQREVALRDRRDSMRTVSPLRPAKDAHVIDTERGGVEAMVQEALRICAGAGLVAA